MKNVWQNLQKSLAQEKLDYLLVEDSSNRRYLTGFTGSAGTVLVPQKGIPQLFVDSRYTLQAKKQTSDFEITEYQNFKNDIWKEFVKKNQAKKIGFESSLTHERLTLLKRNAQGLSLIATKNLVENLRSSKSSAEVKAVKKALKIADQAFLDLLKIIKPGMTEKEIAWKLEVLMREGGAEKTAWEPQIVAAGKNSALPHYGHGATKIKQGNQVQIDYGCVYQGYHTDTSRMIFIGPTTKRQQEIYSLVLAAQKFGISLVKPGAISGEIDQQVKAYLKEKTAGVYRHGLGHGVGLDIHELPTLYTGNQDRLTTGQVITIEPAVYLEGWGGVRIEDMVLVTPTGGEVLTKAPKDIQKVTL